jgi:hypothetical protein
MVGVCIEPVTAQLMMILFAMGSFLSLHSVYRRTVGRGERFVKDMAFEGLCDYGRRVLACSIADQIA